MTSNEKARKEFNKCAKDPIYFIKKYIKVVHPVRGLIPFNLYPFQNRVVDSLDNDRFTILRKFRQAGITTICCAYVLHQCLFKSHQTVPVLSIGDREAKEFVGRVKLMYDELPKIFQRPTITENEHTLEFDNHSIIKSRPSNKQSGRGLSGSLVIFDEAAFIEYMRDIWTAAAPSVATGGRVFVLSTVNGMGNWFYDTYNEAEKNNSPFKTLDINWKDHPEYYPQEGFEDIYIDNWEETMRSFLGPKRWRQEVEAEFLGTGDTYLDGGILTELMETRTQDYIEKYNHRLRIYEDPIPSHEYMISCDVALGRERDYSAFHIIDMFNGKQVGEFYSNKTPISEYAKVIDAEGRRYNTAYCIIERNTIGNNLIDHMLILGYEALWDDEKGQIGIQITQTTREQVLADMEDWIRRSFIKVQAERTIQELLTFIINEDTGKPEADSGKHDDLVMSLAIGVHAIKNLSLSTPMEKELFEENAGPIPGSREATYLGNPNNLVNSTGEEVQEDIKWLLGK